MLRGLAIRRLVVPSSPLRSMWPRRVLRLIAVPARQPPRRGQRPSRRPELEPGENWFYHYRTDEVARDPRSLRGITTRSTNGARPGRPCAAQLGRAAALTRGRPTSGRGDDPFARPAKPAGEPISAVDADALARIDARVAARPPLLAAHAHRSGWTAVRDGDAGCADQRLRTHLRRPAPGQAPRDRRLDDLEQGKADDDRHAPWIGDDEDCQQDAGEKDHGVNCARRPGRLPRDLPDVAAWISGMRPFELPTADPSGHSGAPPRVPPAARRSHRRHRR